MNSSTQACGFILVMHTKVTFWMKFTTIVTSTINAVTSVSATLGNAFIIYVVLRHERLRNPSNILLASLSVTDLLVGLIEQPLSVVRRSMEIQNIHICIIRLIYLYVGYLCAVASVVNIALICIDRCLAVLCPYEYEALAEIRKYCWVIVGVWMAWSIFNLLSALNILSWRIFFFGAILITIISIVTVIISYSLIYRVALKLHRQTLAVGTIGEQNGRTKQRKNYQMAKTLAISIAVLVLCYVPKVSILSIRMVKDSAEMTYIADAWADMFVLINSSFNPIIYCYRLTEIREAVLRTIKRGISNHKRNIREQDIVQNSTTRES